MKPAIGWIVSAAVVAVAYALYPELTRVSFVPDYPAPTSLPRLMGQWSGERILFCQSGSHGEISFLESELREGGQCPECGGPVGPMSTTERRLLPADTVIDKIFYFRTNETKHGWSVAIVFSGQHRNSIHRPEVCLVGDGSTAEIVQTERRKIRRPPLPPLEYTLLRVRQLVRGENGRPSHRQVLFAYWFIGQGVETASHTIRMFWMGWERLRGKAYPWAYVSVSGAAVSPVEATIRELENVIKALDAQLRSDLVASNRSFHQ